VIEAPFTGADTEWQPYEKVITPAAYPDAFLPANNPVRIEFLFESDGAGGDPYAGFYLDDVEVMANR
jgi:hypothetical protein